MGLRTSVAWQFFGSTYIIWTLLVQCAQHVNFFDLIFACEKYTALARGFSLGCGTITLDVIHRVLHFRDSTAGIVASVLLSICIIYNLQTDIPENSSVPALACSEMSKAWGSVCSGCCVWGTAKIRTAAAPNLLMSKFMWCTLKEVLPVQFRRRRRGIATLHSHGAAVAITPGMEADSQNGMSMCLSVHVHPTPGRKC